MNIPQPTQIVEGTDPHILLDVLQDTNPEMYSRYERSGLSPSEIIDDMRVVNPEELRKLLVLAKEADYDRRERSRQADISQYVYVQQKGYK